MKKLKSQSGRSMVEMLGVLAIIGVLSVGGIAGYSLSMRRHRANQVVDLTSKYALYAYSICQQKILNGEYNNITICAENTAFNFKDAGIGNTPAGLLSGMGISTISTDEETGVDTVNVSMNFEDSKLCQAVASTAGSTCTKYGNTYWVEIPIKQN